MCLRVLQGLMNNLCSTLIIATRLPKKLNKEPLIDAVFEVRFSSKVPASVILPGLLFNSLDGEKTIESLPIAQLPKPLRDADPNLRFAPVTRVTWDLFIISISDFSLSISCKYPYPGWHTFKPAITKVVGILSQSKIVAGVERYSMKYVDLLPSTDNQQRVSMINFKVSIADHNLEKEPFHLRIEIPREGFINAVQVVSSAHVELQNETKKEGLIVDVDTFVTLNNVPIGSVCEELSDKLESIHLVNKAMFFDCLTPHSIESLEPIYD